VDVCSYKWFTGKRRGQICLSTKLAIFKPMFSTIQINRVFVLGSADKEEARYL
jgi:hypothetical protein